VEGLQLAANAADVARPTFVARAGDRRLLAGAASLVRIFSSCLSFMVQRTPCRPPSSPQISKLTTLRLLPLQQLQRQPSEKVDGVAVGLGRVDGPKKKRQPVAPCPSVDADPP
jgi:hypothetical protein